MESIFLLVIYIIPVFYFLFKGFKKLWYVFYFHVGDRFKRKALSIRLDKMFERLWSYILFRVFGSLLALALPPFIIFISLVEKKRSGRYVFNQDNEASLVIPVVISIVLWGVYIWVQMIKDIRGKKNQSNITENTD